MADDSIMSPLIDNIRGLLSVALRTRYSQRLFNLLVIVLAIIYGHGLKCGNQAV